MIIITGASCFWPSRRRTLASSNNKQRSGVDSTSVWKLIWVDIEERRKKDERRKLRRLRCWHTFLTLCEIHSTWINNRESSFRWPAPLFVYRSAQNSILHMYTLHRDNPVNTRRSFQSLHPTGCSLSSRGHGFGWLIFHYLTQSLCRDRPISSAWAESGRHCNCEEEQTRVGADGTPCICRLQFRQIPSKRPL